MPFCTECGHQNPEGAKFCSQCGHRIATEPSAGEPAPEAGTTAAEVIPPVPPTQGEPTSTMTFGAPSKDAEHREERSLNPSDAAAVDALPPGSALLVVQRGPSAG
ncbi:MAG: zinc-ribbon domain-containing protein, partial [Nocardioidaceae bacterium]